jgi:hypothetical protein
MTSTQQSHREILKAGGVGTPLVEALEQLDWLAKEVISALRSVEVSVALSI